MDELTGEDAETAAGLIMGEVAQNQRWYTKHDIDKYVGIAQRLRVYADGRSD